MRKQEAVEYLNRLIQTCRDGEEFCRTLSDASASEALASLLRRHSEDWGRYADELQALVLHLEGQPKTAGTASAWLSRARVIAKSALLGPSDTGALAEWQRMQEDAVHRYKEALSSQLPERIRRTVSLQSDRLEDRCGRIVGLRGQYALHTHGA
jgi:uncharacterized protein (TIGR02284 family)